MSIRLAGGLWGPAAFITGWVVLGAQRDGYSAVEDPISRLAAVDASTRLGMTLALVIFSAGLLLYASAIGDELGQPVAVAAAVNALATLGVALTPLDSSVGGTPHAIAAGVGYASLAAMPLLASGHLARRSMRWATAVSVSCGAVCAAALTVSVAAGGAEGLWQRLGLTVGDLWIMTTAAALVGVRGRTRRSSP